MRLDELKLRESILVGLDVVAVLYLVKPVCRALMLLVSTLIILVGTSSSYSARCQPHPDGYRTAQNQHPVPADPSYCKSFSE